MNTITSIVAMCLACVRLQTRAVVKRNSRPGVVEYFELK